MALADITAQRFLNALFGIGSNDFGGFNPSAPTLFLAAATSATTPADDGTGFAEVSTVGTAYERVAIASAYSTAASESGGLNTISNDALIQFAQATSTWGSITHVALFDSDVEGAGTLLFFAQLSSATQIDANDRLAFQVGDLQWSLT